METLHRGRAEKETQRLAVDITDAKKVEQIRKVMVNWLEERRKELAATAEGAGEKKKTEMMEDSKGKDVATGDEEVEDQRKQGGNRRRKSRGREILRGKNKGWNIRKRRI